MASFLLDRIMNDSEISWNAAREDKGWVLPDPSHWFFRLPVIRRIRWLYRAIQVERHYRLWDAIGSIRTGYDEWVLYAIARGWG